jgi:hypothetical protein
MTWTSVLHICEPQDKIQYFQRFLCEPNITLFKSLLLICSALSIIFSFHDHCGIMSSPTPLMSSIALYLLDYLFDLLLNQALPSFDMASITGLTIRASS